MPTATAVAQTAPINGRRFLFPRDVETLSSRRSKAFPPYAAADPPVVIAPCTWAARGSACTSGGAEVSCSTRSRFVSREKLLPMEEIRALLGIEPGRLILFGL